MIFRVKKFKFDPPALGLILGCLPSRILHNILVYYNFFSSNFDIKFLLFLEYQKITTIYRCYVVYQVCQIWCIKLYSYENYVWKIHRSLIMRHPLHRICPTFTKNKGMTLRKVVGPFIFWLRWEETHLYPLIEPSKLDFKHLKGLTTQSYHEVIKMCLCAYIKWFMSVQWHTN